ncbi:uncharacterized protein [Triticum aestivum]|uniref:uncharacterized protein n=1 Tax=Triticum aestivum TaxID=4565 RepID=UPI001D0095BF|nr:uncharacterized protein LOC123066981 [Triticum aestivum]
MLTPRTIDNPHPSIQTSPPSQDMDKQRRSSLDEDDLPFDQDNLPSYFVKLWDGQRFDYYDTRLETWDDTTPRELESITVKDFDAAIAKACEEYVREIEEDDRKSLMMALEVYTKQNNMQPTDLEFVQVKERNILLDEDAKSYLHFNFLVKGLDGKQTMFFAELCLKITDEKDVLLCTPLGEDDFKLSKENEQACCKGCEDRAKGLIHPSCGSHLVGHDEIHPSCGSHLVGHDEEPDDDYM